MAGTTTYYGISYPTNTDYVKDGASAIQTVATGFDSAVAIPTYNNQTGATYTFALTDVGKTVTASNASAQTYTIPPTASVAWPTGTTLDVINLGVGTVTFAAGAGVTVTNTAQTLSQYQSARLVRTALNAWTITSDNAGTPGSVLLSSTSFSAVASQSINNVFTSAYENYQIVINAQNSAASSQLKFNLRVSGTDNTTANYAYSGTGYDTAGTLDNTTLEGQTFWEAGYCTAASIGFYANLSIFSPQSALRTTMHGGSPKGISATRLTNRFYGYLFNATTQFDGFTLTASTGTITGNVYVYGTKK